MSGDKVCSPDSESAPITTYYSHSPDIPTYQKALFLHVYIQLWPLKKNFPLENLPRTYAHVIDINIERAPARDEEIYQKWTLNGFQILYLCR